MKIYFFLLSVCAEELLSAPNIITFLTNLLPLYNEKDEHALNPIPYTKQKYLSGSVFLVNLTAPNKEFPNAKSAPTIMFKIF